MVETAISIALAAAKKNLASKGIQIGVSQLTGGGAGKNVETTKKERMLATPVSDKYDYEEWKKIFVEPKKRRAEKQMLEDEMLSVAENKKKIDFEEDSMYTVARMLAEQTQQPKSYLSLANKKKRRKAKKSGK